MRSRLAIPLAFALSAPAAPLVAQTDTMRVVALDSLRVTITRALIAPDRMPAALASLGVADIRGGRANIGLDESLDRVPGLVVNNRYNFALGSRISIRGLGARSAFGVRGVRIISDGIPLTMPDGQTNLNNLDLGAAGRIDVLRGPASSLHGNAAGGVISVSSEAPPPRFSTAARLLAGDADHDGLTSTTRLQARAGGPLGNGGFLVSASRLDTDGYREYSRAEQTLLNIVARQSLSPNDVLTFVFNGVDAPVAQSTGALPRDSVARNRRMAWPNNIRTLSGEKVRQVQGGVSYSRNDVDRRTDVSLYGLGRSLDNALPFGFIDLGRQGAGARTTFTFTPSGDAFSFTLGIDAEWQRDERREWNNDGGRPGEDLRRDQIDRVQTFGPFAQAIVALDERTDIIGGLRYDAVRFETEDRLTVDGVDDSGNRTLSSFSPMVGITRRTEAGWSLFGNFSTGFQTPTTTELINAPPAPGERCCPTGFNRSLKPQRALSFEVGAKGALGDATFDLSAYHMSVQNTIVPFQVAGVEGRDFFRNAGKTRHQGFEAALSKPLGRHSATLSYTFNHFTFRDDGDPDADWEGNRLPGIPRHHLFAGVALRPNDRLRLDLEIEHTGSYYASDANDAASRNDAATVTDIRAAYDVRVSGTLLTPFVALNNIANTRYNSSVVVNGFGGRYFEPAPGRNIFIGLAVGTGSWGR